MRPSSRALLLCAAFVAAASVRAAAAHEPLRTRKSLSFGPVLPHATFNAAPQVAASSWKRCAPETDPLEVAQLFVEHHLRDHLSSEVAYVIRDDSYTDERTGVTHVYVRQLVNGIEVQDGDMNLNIKDGEVLSFGDSFYRGAAPAPFTNPAAVVGTDAHAIYCNALSAEIASHMASPGSGAQTVLHSQIEMSPILLPLHTANCAPEHQTPLSSVVSPAFSSEPNPNVVMDPRHALLQFMALATPSQSTLADIQTNFDKHISAMTSTFDSKVTGSHVSPVELIENVPDAVAPVKTTLTYVQVPSGDEVVLSLVWRFEVQMRDNWYEAYVSATAPHRAVSVVDWASDAYAPIPTPDEPTPKLATYNVFQWGINDPSQGNRTFEKEPVDEEASPLGWHVVPVANDPFLSDVQRKKSKTKYTNTTTTWGNNVFAHEDWEGASNWLYNYRPEAADLVFNYTYNPTASDPSDQLELAHEYINATATQLFYTTNMVHDLFYHYGFDEVSGNFQQYNFGRGGKENDAVIANAQDGSGMNNANFMTPPDGQHGICRMYLWNTANPYRDGDFEAGVVIHELAHGLSTRLTGGPMNSGCLGWGESGGMGEGWGDFLATTIRSNKNYSDYPMGEWVANRATGIRNYPYSLEEEVNPSTYKFLDKPGYWGVHAIGEVWAEILWTASQKLIVKHGFSDSLFPPSPSDTDAYNEFYRTVTRPNARTGKDETVHIPAHGNSLIVQLVLDGMKLQPCRPSFFDARDAIIQADQLLTGGENYCELWEGFAERGLGPDARVEGRTPWGGGIRTNDFEVPLTCGK